MTETTGTTPPPEPATTASPASRWKLITGFVAGAAVLAAGITAFAVTRDSDDDDRPQTAATQQIAAARQACQQWLDNDTSSRAGGPGPGWCDEMAGWMSDNMVNARMMGPMMWASADAMRDACAQAMGTRRPADGTPQWSDQMVSWMSQHMGDWNDWRGYWG
jgi:hypothetical protein